MPIVERKIEDKIRHKKLYDFIVESDYNSYKEYLQSNHWKDVIRRFYKSKLNKRKCYVCTGRYRLNLHHKTYKRLGHEWLSDLIQLCGKCHLACHRLLEKARKKGKRRITLWNAAKRLKRKRGMTNKRRQKRANKKRKKHKKSKKKKGVGIFRVF